MADLVVAGLLTGAGVPADQWDDVDAVADRLRPLLHGNSLWQPASVDRTEAERLRRVAPGTPRWRRPESIDDPDILIEAWERALPPPIPTHPYPMQRALRLQVVDVDDARLLRDLGVIGDDILLVPSFQSRSHRSLRWHWPMVVGVSNPWWLDVLERSGHYDVIYTAELLDPDRFYDIAIVDVPDDYPASCVLVVHGPPDFPQRSRAPISAVFATEPDQWWHSLFHELSHDNPIDVAAIKADPSTVVAIPAEGSEITAAARWFYAAAEDEPFLAAQLDDVPGWDFTYERGGASNISRLGQAVEHQTGERPVVEVSAPVAAAAAPDIPVTRSARPDQSGSRHRRLIAEFWSTAGEPVRTVLAPAADMMLEVKIAVPTEGQIAAAEDFPAVPTDRPVETLEVVVTNDEVWPSPQRQEISLPTAPDQLAEPSTSAAFAFVTPPAGRVVEFDVVVYFRNRPLQAATLTATVRDRALPTDRPTLRTHAVTGPSEPTPTASPVDASLDARGAELRDRFGNRLALTRVQDLLDEFERLLSRRLGLVDAPSRLDDERALEVLIELARRGSLLHAQLGLFSLDDADTIDVVVNDVSAVFPLELVYDGPAPKPAAKPCRHIAEGFDEPTRCRRSPSRICPYGFWGMTRVISRSVVSLGPEARPPRTDTALDPHPVLYAATVIADEGAEGVLPSNRVEKAIADRFGAVTRVTSWTKWRRSVRSERPKLLVVLGHTDTERGEVWLHIGSRSKLAQPDIDHDVVGRVDEPPPVLVLMACATAQLGGPFGTLPGAFAAHGAGAVIGTLSKINGPQGADAATALLTAIDHVGQSGGRLSQAMTEARRALVAQGLVAGLVLVSHGEIDVHVRG
jgi:hypothetical protein